MPMRLARLALAAFLAAACVAPPRTAGTASLRFIGEQRIAHRHALHGTIVGGLSGLDYNARRRTWILASDDRSEHGPARFYAARFDLDAAGFRSVTLDGVHLFRQPDGSTYPAPPTVRELGGAVPDIEAIRFDPVDASIWYASEGDPARPLVRHADASGAWRATLPLPAMFTGQPGASVGARSNLGVEGLAFAPDGQSLWLAMEAPLFQDGPLADRQHGAVVRLTQVDRSGQMLAQHAYPLDPVAAAAAPGRFSDNGVADVLVFDAHHLLVLERSGVQDASGAFRFHIRLYLAPLAGAADVRAVAALGPTVRPLRKRLFLDVNAAGLPQVDNIEGMAWGPALPNGHRSLVLVSDDNFSEEQVTQLLAFEVATD
jgi:hypothetical protein